MEAYYISAFIDDQLNLDEKIELVQTVHEDKAFKDETLNFLFQEKQLRVPAVERAPQVTVNSRQRHWSWRGLKQWGYYAFGLATALLLIFVFQPKIFEPVQNAAHRFVIYQPGIQAASLMGSFNDWQMMTMHPSGSSGYWEITVELPPGEYRYNFLIDGQHQIADPTSLVQERDDFGGVNSIIAVQSKVAV